MASFSLLALTVWLFIRDKQKYRQKGGFQIYVKIVLKLCKNLSLMRRLRDYETICKGIHVAFWILVLISKYSFIVYHGATSRKRENDKCQFKCKQSFNERIIIQTFYGLLSPWDINISSMHYKEFSKCMK